MAFLDNYMTVKEARDYLAMNGVDWTLVWLRMKISAGTVKSEKRFNSRLISRAELARIIKEKKAEKKARMVYK